MRDSTTAITPQKVCPADRFAFPITLFSSTATAAAAAAVHLLTRNHKSCYVFGRDAFEKRRNQKRTAFAVETIFEFPGGMTTAAAAAEKLADLQRCNAYITSPGPSYDPSYIEYIYTCITLFFRESVQNEKQNK